MLNKEQKKQIVKELAESFKSSKSVVVTDFKGLTVNDMQDLKIQLREQDARYKVAKKTLLNLAAKEAGIDIDFIPLDGQIGVSFSDKDEVSAAKTIDKFAKKNENIKLLAGILGKKVLNADEVKALAKLPSYEELLAKLVWTIKAPLTGMVNVLQGNQRGLVQALKAIADKKA